MTTEEWTIAHWVVHLAPNIIISTCSFYVSTKLYLAYKRYSTTDRPRKISRLNIALFGLLFFTFGLSSFIRPIFIYLDIYEPIFAINSIVAGITLIVALRADV